MIVNDVLGAAELDDGQAFGCPFHGLVRDSQLTLLNGEKVDYLQPGGVQQAGRTLLIQPTWASGGTVNQKQIAKGWSWEKYAILGGENAVLHGQALGEGCWIWAEQPGQIWLVDASGLLAGDPTTHEVSTVDIKLTRFGWLGELPADQERTRTINVAFPALQHSGTSAYDNWPYTYNNDFPRKCLLADTHPQDGHRALFSIVLDWGLPDGIATAAVLELNLQTGLFSVLADGSSNGSYPNGMQQTQYNPTSDPMQDNVVLVKSDSTQCLAPNGIDYSTIDTYTYEVQGQIPIPNVHNADYVDTYVYLLGAGYDQAGNARVIQAKTIQETVINYWNVHTFGGSKIVNNCAGTVDDSSYHTISANSTRTYTVKLSLVTTDGISLFERESTTVQQFVNGSLSSTVAQGLDGESWPYTITLSPFLGTTNFGNQTNIFGTVKNPNTYVNEPFQIRGLVALAPNSFAYVLADQSSYNYNAGDPGFSTMAVKSIFNAAGLGGDLASQVSASYFQGFASIHPTTGERCFNNQTDGPCCYV